MRMLLEYRFVFVIALLAVAVALVADRNRLPLALRGVRRALGGSVSAERRQPVSRWRRLLALTLVLAAFLLAVAG